MTVYATEADFIAAFGNAEFEQLTTESVNNAPVQDKTGFNDQLERTSRIIDVEIGGRYLVPLTLPIDGIINQICLDVTRWYLYDDSVPEAVQRRYDNSLKMLERVKNGNAIIDASPAAVVINSSSLTIATGTPAIFTDEYLDNLL